MKLTNSIKELKIGRLLLLIVLAFNVTVCVSQSIPDSCKYPCDVIPYTDRQDINCLRCLANEVDINKIITRKDSTIAEYISLDSTRVDRIEDYKIEVVELTISENKAVKGLKKARKGLFTAVVVIIIETLILVLR